MGMGMLMVVHDFVQYFYQNGLIEAITVVLTDGGCGSVWGDNLENF